MHRGTPSKLNHYPELYETLGRHKDPLLPRFFDHLQQENALENASLSVFLGNPQPANSGTEYQNKEREYGSRQKRWNIAGT